MHLKTKVVVIIHEQATAEPISSLGGTICNPRHSIVTLRKVLVCINNNIIAYDFMAHKP